jgi:hypothetical protein
LSFQFQVNLDLKETVPFHSHFSGSGTFRSRGNSSFPSLSFSFR